MSQINSEDRRNPFAGVALAPGSEVIPAVLARPPRRQGRKHPLRPAEERRRHRKMTVTFSDSAIVDRARAQAARWGLTGPDGQSPGLSELVEYLLLPRLLAAERGEVAPPPRVE